VVLYAAKIYAPENFGIYSSVLSMAAIIVVIATAQMPYIIQKINTQIASLLATIITKIYFTISIVLMVLIYFLAEGNTVRLYSIEFFLYVLLVALPAVCFSIQSSVLIKKDYSFLYGIIILLRGLSIALYIVFIGPQWTSIHALLLSTVIPELLISIFMMFSCRVVKETKGIKIISLIREYKDYTLWGMLQDLTNAIAHGIPLLIFAYNYKPELIGYYALAYRLLDSINSLLGNSIRMPLLRKMHQIESNQAELNVFLNKSAYMLIAIALVISTFFILFYNTSLIEYFGNMMGRNWTSSTDYIALLLPWFLMMIINIPFANLVRVRSKQKELFSVNNFIVVVRLLGALFLSIVCDDLFVCIMFYALLNTILNVVYIRRCISISNIGVYR
jgi:O-antigen/teichoic acid export membrane protein